MSELGHSALQVVEGVVILYTFGYAVASLTLILVGFGPVLDAVRRRAFADLDLVDEDTPGMKPIAVIIPAYDEAPVIVDVVQALLRTDYPSFEIVIVNDGSTDTTLACLRSAFHLRRTDFALRAEVPTAAVRGVYVAQLSLPQGVERLVVVDKENGGRADALNAGLNASLSPYFVTIDADSILEPTALKQMMRGIMEDPQIVASGGTIGVVNACELENGRVLRSRIPRRYFALCQTLEYVRSFSIARTGFTALDSLVILSGAFLLMRRDLAIEAGGFLTGRSRSSWVNETIGAGKATICEDMELIVRIHRLERDHGRRGRVVHVPTAICWTQVPENLPALAKQRRRWHRGLIEILRYNHSLFLNPSYGRIGLFAIPYFVYFELMGPYVEFLGWFVLPILAMLGCFDPVRAALIMAVALGAGVLQSLLSVLCATWILPAASRQSLLGADSWRDRLLLLLGCFLGEMGFRQLSVLWRLHGTWDYLRGRTGWDKFERRGFRKAAVATSLLLTLVPARPVSGAAQESVLIGAREERTAEREDGVAFEFSHSIRSPRSSGWVGFERLRRGTDESAGLILGAGWHLPQRGGASVEFRHSQGMPLAEQRLRLDSEWGWVDPLSATLRLAHGRFADASIVEVGPGVIFYFASSAWLALRANYVRTDFAAQAHDTHDTIFGANMTLHLPFAARQLFLHAGRGGEHYLAAQDAQRLRSQSIGVELRQDVGRRWALRAGATRWQPELGDAVGYLHLAVVHRFGSSVLTPEPADR